jgi:3-hydroxyacyl-CoA dehydrogenase
MTVHIETRDGIALVTIDNPPVNATGHAVRQGLCEAVARTEGDRAVRAVVLACAGRSFIAGADIREFGQPSKPPHLPDVLARIAAATKPWVAAIHGTALGGARPARGDAWPCPRRGRHGAPAAPHCRRSRA